MLKTLTVLNRFLGTILALAIMALMGGVGWFGYRTYYAEKWALEDAEDKLLEQQTTIEGLTEDLRTGKKEIHRLNQDLSKKSQKIATLNKDLEAKQRQIEKLATALRLLKIDHRVAQLDVLSRQGSADDGNLVTKFSFVEVDHDGKPLEEPRVFTISGDLVYVDAWVVKFTDEHVELGDPLRSTSICLFRRVFGESQQPKDGFALDPVGSRPAAYRNGGKMSEFEQELWSRFWDYANDPVKAKEKGVRAAHGEAPSIKLVPGNRYKVQLRASGGLSMVPEKLPPAPARKPL